MQKQRKTVEGDQVKMAWSLGTVRGLQFLLKGRR